MALQRKGIDVPFGSGLDTKTDPNQVQAGKFLSMINNNFSKGSLLSKRNGFGDLLALPNALQTNLATINDNLLATGSNLYSYAPNINTWLNQGLVQPAQLSVLPLVRNSRAQVASDSAISYNGLICTTYLDGAQVYYQINDVSTGSQVVAAVAINATALSARVLVLNNYFVVVYIATVSASPHLQYIAIPIVSPSAPLAAANISTSVSGLTAGYDCVVANNTLYTVFNGSDGGGAVRITPLSSTLIVGAAKIITSRIATLASITADNSGSTPVIWASYWDTGTGDAYTSAYSQSLVQLLAPTKIISAKVITELTSLATANVLTLYYQTTKNYSYASIRSDFVSTRTITLAGSLGTATVLKRSVGLASKAFYLNSMAFVLVAYGGAFQPSYFLLNNTGAIITKLAYSNGGGYETTQVLPSVYVAADTAKFTYLIKDLLVSVNKTQGAANVAGIYSQTGVNLATIVINSEGQLHSEIAGSLHLTGGQLWQYDGVAPIEHGFDVWPEDLLASTSAAGGALTDQQYYYAFTYEWTDATGTIHRSAPSVPIGQLTAGGNTSTNTINVPTLRLTAKTSVRLVGYRWSTAQQNYYQFTSITNPVLNDQTVDSIAVTDTLADSSILGNSLLYTTGGVLENIGAPANSGLALYKSRLFLIAAEDRNTVWYSKQVLPGTPVELTDLLTLYVAPTSGAQGSTGALTALSAMDDKLILFKNDAAYYITGNGPNATGADNDFSDAVYITGTVGCSNANSIVLTPRGIMFQSDKGIWLLGRDLSTSYIGAPVEAFNSSLVKAALTIPGTNEVRFTLNNGQVLIYDYYYDQWGSNTNVPAISATLYQGLHTYLNNLGQIRQETLGQYLDGANPVLMSFTTAWLKLTNLQGFLRAYRLYLLATYLSPHKLNVQIAYNYDSTIRQTTIISPTNSNVAYGGDNLYGGGSPMGGTGNLEQWRINLDLQKCESVQLTITEIFDASKGQPAGAGFSMSGINFVLGIKDTKPKLGATQIANQTIK